MWWPITGMVKSNGDRLPGSDGMPAIDTGGYEFRALPADISMLNRRAVEHGDLDITAISVRTYADVRGRYRLTSCGASFGDGYGPKVICREDSSLRDARSLLSPEVRVAIPGRGTTAFLTLGLLLLHEDGRTQGSAAARGVDLHSGRFVEMRFDRVMSAVASGEMDAGIVIHDAQLTFARDGLRLLVDLGAWWKAQRGLPLPLGANVIRRDLDARFGPDATTRVCEILQASIRHALAHREQGLAYAATFAEAGAAPPDSSDIDQFVRLYVNDYTLDMGETGREAIAALLRNGAAADLCQDPGEIDIANPSALR